MQRARTTLAALLILSPLACKAEGQKTDTAADRPTENTADAGPAADAPPKPDPETAAVQEPTGPAKLGEKAPNFELTDLDGTKHTLAQYAGKTVVLEWFNPGCPFVKYSHGEGPLKAMAAKRAEEGVVWLAINSGAPGKQGHGVETNREAASKWGMKHPILIDESGDVGHLYGALKTPHMYVINPEGVLTYAGAIDNAPMGETQEGEPVNYVSKCLTAMASGKGPEQAETKPYGCSVKYAKS